MRPGWRHPFVQARYRLLVLLAIVVVILCVGCAHDSLGVADAPGGGAHLLFAMLEHDDTTALLEVTVQSE